MKFKTFLIIMLLNILLLFVPIIVNAGEMEDTLLDIESELDICIESKDANICDELEPFNDYIIKFMGNQDYMKELAKCKIGDECASMMYRIVAKMTKATNIWIGLE